MRTIEKAIEKLIGGRSSNDQGRITTVAATTIGAGAPPQGQARSRHVELDRASLAANGFLIPENARSPLAEEYRRIKRPLLKNAFGETAAPIENGNIIVVTSSLPGEGKTYTSINLAMSMAMELDHTVLLIDADVARPALMRYLGVAAERGLTDYLLNENLELADLLLKTNVPELTLLSAGSLQAHATELLASQNMRRLIDELSKRYHDRVVILDTPPLLATSEASVLANLAGQIVVVVEAERTPQTNLNEALSLLDRSKKPVGLVLNKSRRARQADAYGYYYHSGNNKGSSEEKREA